MPTVQEAILALSPTLYWPLDTGNADGALDLSGNLHNAVLGGTYDFNVTGVENDRNAVRMYSDAAIRSTELGLTAVADFTLMLWASVPAAGGIATFQRILSIGDRPNPTTRGYMIEYQSTAANSGTFAFAAAASLNPQAAVPNPTVGWHHIAITYTVSGTARRIYMDGNVTLTTAAVTVAPQSADVFAFQPVVSIVGAHTAFWNRALSQTEIQSISSLRAQWPMDLPANTQPDVPPVTVEGGGLTPEQAAQLDAVDTKTDDIPGLVAAATYISDTVNTILGKVNSLQSDTAQLLSNWAGYTSVTLPSLQDMLNNISAGVSSTLDGITTTVSTGTGDVLAKVGELLKPISKYDLFQLELTDGPTCERFDQLVVGPFLGIRVHITQRPDDLVLYAPDHDFARPDYCTVNVWQMGQHVARYGVHQVDWQVHEFSPTKHVNLQVFHLLINMPDTHVVVDWMPGVCGQVWLFKAPPGWASLGTS